MSRENIYKYKLEKENKQHGSYLLPYEIYRTIIPRYISFYPIHWHEEIEIIYAVSGKCRYYVDFVPYEIVKGDILIIPSTSLHGFEKIDNYNFEGLTLVINETMINNNSIDICSAKYIRPIFNNEIIFPTHIKTTEGNNKELSKIILSCVKCHFEKKEGYELGMKIYFLRFIQYLFENKMYVADKNPMLSDKNNIYTKNIIEYIENHYMEKITLEDLANYCNISVYHLARLFKKLTGKSPIDYICQYRLTIASNMLISTNKSIIEIALDTGFNNISYFNRAFKNKFGITPRGYRDKNL